VSRLAADLPKSIKQYNEGKMEIELRADHAGYELKK